MDTPCLVIDLDVAERNIARFQALADQAGLSARPHIKTHKMTYFAKKQIAAGAVGITCQKIGEAELMAQAGIEDILITFNIYGEEKLDRLAALAKTCRLTVTCDNAVIARGLSQRFASAMRPLTVLVECDTGAGRCGVQTPQETLDLARTIDALPGLEFGGVMTYPPIEDSEKAAAWIGQAVELISAAGLAIDVISMGGTPNLDDLSLFQVATEHRAGTYIFNDRSLIEKGACEISDCAATIKATIVSRPTRDRAIIDAGSKTLSSDLLGLEGFGMIVGAPEAKIVALSEEHGTIDLSGTGWDPAVGDEVSIIPNHICVVVNLVGEVYLKAPEGKLELMFVEGQRKLR